jgi:hypothetical protein
MVMGWPRPLLPSQGSSTLGENSCSSAASSANGVVPSAPNLRGCLGAGERHHEKERARRRLRARGSFAGSRRCLPRRTR